jgi:hypothetical protein
MEAEERDSHLKIILTGSDCVSAERAKGKAGMGSREILGWEFYCVFVIVMLYTPQSISGST